MKLLIIDGHNLLFQMFFGMPSRIINKDGKAIQGTLGFVGAMLRIIRMANPTHVDVLFDSEQENARAEINADYKANRTDYNAVKDGESPFSQIDDVSAALNFPNIKNTEVKGYETDDVIASYALTYGKDMEIVISSFDSDFFQLITDNVTVFRYRGVKSVICDTKYIQEKFGIFLSQYADFKSLTGDASDNIKGAEKVGPKTASELINQLGSLSEIIKDATKIKKTSIRASIHKNADRLLKNYEIMKLDNRAKVPFDFAELEYKYSGITTSDVLQGIGLK